VRATGGLIDTVTEFDPMRESGTGFVFNEFDKWAFFGTVARAVQAYRFRDEWQELMRRAMRTDHSWRASAERYVDIYERALAWHISDVDLHHPSDFETSLPGLGEMH